VQQRLRQLVTDLPQHSSEAHMRWQQVPCLAGHASHKHATHGSLIESSG